MLLDRKPLLRYHLLAAVILTFIMRMALPQVRYAYYPLFILLVADLFISKPDRNTLKRILRQLAPYLLLLAIFLAASLYHTAFWRPYIEIVNALELAAILIILFYYTRRTMQWSSFRSAFVRQLFLLAVITALMGLGRLVFALMGGDLHVEEGESLVSTASDYNFFALALLYGLILGIYQLFSLSKPGKGSVWLYNTALLSLVAGIVLVPSRRGAIILALILFSLIIIRVIALFARRYSGISRIRRMDYLLVAVLTAMVGLSILLFHTSHSFKEDFLIRSGLYRMDVRSKLTDAWCRYGRLVDKDIQFREAYEHLWMNGRNREEERILIDQSFTEGRGDFRRQGNTRVKVISQPQGSGCLAIRAAGPEQGLISEFYVDVGDTIEVLAMVRVIEWNKHLGLSIPDRHNRKRLHAAPERKWEGDGQWHPVRRRVVYDVFGSLPLWFGGGSSPDSSSLSCWSRIQVRRMNPAKKMQNPEMALPTDQEKRSLPEFPDAKIARLMPPVKHKTQNAGNNMGAESTIGEKLTSSGKSTVLPDAVTSALLQEFPDRGTLDSLKAMLKGPFPDNRSGRWRLARQIFSNYTFSEKLIGNGLTWLPVYGEFFYENPRYYDYPHNPLISTVLYSGIVGGLFYLAYLGWSLFLYFKYRKQYGLFLVLFLLTGVFVSVSGNSHFSVPAFAFFTQLPFFFSYIHKDIISSNE